MNHSFPNMRLYKSTLAATVFIFATSFAQAATITVNNDFDGTDQGIGICTLRDAVAAINAGSDPDPSLNGCTNGDPSEGYGTNDTIQFDSTVFNASATIEVVNGGEIEIEKDLIITGPIDPVTDAPLITLDAGPGGTANNRIFDTYPSDTFTVENLIFKNGNDTGSQGGGAIRGPSTLLTVHNCVFEDNQAAEQGGAIYVRLNAVVSKSTFSGNMADFGGAIMGAFSSNVVAVIAVSDSTFSNNTADYGGAIDGDKIVVSASTFFNNTGTTDGGAINAYGAAVVSASTFLNNSATDHGGAIRAAKSLDARHLTMLNNMANEGASVYVDGYEGSKTMEIHNSIIIGENLGNASAHCEMDTTNSPSNIGSYNLEWTVGDTALVASCGTAAPGITTMPASLADIIATTLADNGGLTQTLALPGNSPAYAQADQTGTSQMWDFAANAGAGDWVDATEDQRAFARKILGMRDLGAYEANATAGMVFTPAALSGIEGESFSSSIGSVTGCQGSCTFVSNNPPAGMTLNGNGNLSGTLPDTGIVTFDVTITDSGTNQLEFNHEVQF